MGDSKYCYPGNDVFINKLNIHNQSKLLLNDALQLVHRICKEGVEGAMGGEILELESERQRIIGKIDVYYKELNYSIDKIAEILHISSDEVEEIINILQKEEKDNP